MFNSVAVRYVDLLDTYLTPGGLCHPADNFGAILAVAESAGASGADFLLALAVAYEVQSRFSASVPVMAHGLNHALQLAISVAAGAAKLLRLNADQTADAISIAAADNVSLAAIHSEPVSNWKGISPGITAQRAVYTTALAQRGITGPRGIFEGPNGLERLFGQPIDLRPADPTLGVVKDTYLKKYCALIHAQAPIETVLALAAEHGIPPGDIASFEVEVFQTAYDIAGGGSFGTKDAPATKEQADYNLKYLLAAALIDGQVGPEQLQTERISRPDVQDLLNRINVRPDAALTARYPQATPVRITIVLRDGQRRVPRAGRLRRRSSPAVHVGPHRGEIPLACRAIRRRRATRRDHRHRRKSRGRPDLGAHRAAHPRQRAAAVSEDASTIDDDGPGQPQNGYVTSSITFRRLSRTPR